MQVQRPFFGRIESLRGIGALAVAAYHLSGWPLHGRPVLPEKPWEGVGPIQNALGQLSLMLIPGHAALMMFFAISGCVLYVSLQYGPQSLLPAAKRFVVSRIFRIYPIVIVGVLVCLWAESWTGGPGGPSRPIGEILSNMLLLDASINGVFWALQVEVLTVPVILLLYFVDRSFGPRPLVAVALVTTALSFSMHWAFWPPLSNNLFAFVVGMLIPTIGRDWTAAMSPRAAKGWLILSIVVFLSAGPLFGFYSRFAAVFETYAAFVLLSIAAYRPDVRALALLDRWSVRQLGVASGSYYVLHVPLLIVTAAIATLLIPAGLSENVPLLAGWLAIAFSLVAIAPVAVLSYRLVEATGIAAGRRLLQTRRAVAA